MYATGHLTSSSPSKEKEIRAYELGMKIHFYMDSFLHEFVKMLFGFVKLVWPCHYFSNDEKLLINLTVICASGRTKPIVVNSAFPEYC